MVTLHLPLLVAGVLGLNEYTQLRHGTEALGPSGCPSLGSWTSEDLEAELAKRKALSPGAERVAVGSAGELEELTTTGTTTGAARAVSAAQVRDVPEDDPTPEDEPAPAVIGGGLSEFPTAFDCKDWTLGDGEDAADIVLQAVRIKLIVPFKDGLGWERTKRLSNCDCAHQEKKECVANPELPECAAECICRMVATAENADAEDFSLAETGTGADAPITSIAQHREALAVAARGAGNQTNVIEILNGIAEKHQKEWQGTGEDQSQGGRTTVQTAQTSKAAPAEPARNPLSCRMAFTWSQYEKITRCDCDGCVFERQGQTFVSHCGSCDCGDATTTRCIPGFFSIADKPNITTWGAAETYFEETMCVVRGRHPIELCKKMKCEAFGGEGCDQDSTWKIDKAKDDAFEPDPAYCRILDVLKEAHFAHKYGRGSVIDDAGSELRAAKVEENSESAYPDAYAGNAWVSSQTMTLGNPPTQEQSAQKSLGAQQFEKMKAQVQTRNEVKEMMKEQFKGKLKKKVEKEIEQAEKEIAEVYNSRDERKKEKACKDDCKAVYEQFQQDTNTNARGSVTRCQNKCNGCGDDCAYKCKDWRRGDNATCTDRDNDATAVPCSEIDALPRGQMGGCCAWDGKCKEDFDWCDGKDPAEHERSREITELGEERCTTNCNGIWKIFEPPVCLQTRTAEMKDAAMVKMQSCELECKMSNPFYATAQSIKLQKMGCTYKALLPIHGYNSGNIRVKGHKSICSPDRIAKSMEKYAGGTQWVIGGNGADRSSSGGRNTGSCDDVCEALGETCIQSELDALNGNNDLVLQKYAEAGQGSYCSQIKLDCERDNNCERWGAPYIHNSHFNQLCWGGSPPAPCGGKPVDANHRRLCPCTGIGATCPDGSDSLFGSDSCKAYADKFEKRFNGGCSSQAQYNGKQDKDMCSARPRGCSKDESGNVFYNYKDFQQEAEKSGGDNCICQKYEVSGVNSNKWYNGEWVRDGSNKCGGKPVYKKGSNRFLLYDESQNRWEFSDGKCSKDKNWYPAPKKKCKSEECSPTDTIQPVVKPVCCDIDSWCKHHCTRIPPNCPHSLCSVSCSEEGEAPEGLLEGAASELPQQTVRSSLAAKRTAAMKTLVDQHRHSPDGRMSLIQNKADASLGSKGTGV